MAVINVTPDKYIRCPVCENDTCMRTIILIQKLEQYIGYDQVTNQRCRPVEINSYLNVELHCIDCGFESVSNVYDTMHGNTFVIDEDAMKIAKKSSGIFNYNDNREIITDRSYFS